MATINLAPGTHYIIAARKRRQRLLAVSVGIVLVTAGGWGALVLKLKQTLLHQETLNAAVRTIDLTIAQSENEAKRVVSFEKRLIALNTLLNHHIVWNPIFTELERLLPPPIILLNANFNAESGKIDVKGITSDMDQVAQALASLHATPSRPTLFTSSTLGSVDRVDSRPNPDNPNGGVTYTFNANLTFNPQATVPGK